MLEAAEGRLSGERLVSADAEDRAGSGTAPWQMILGAVLRARYLATAARARDHASETGAGGCLRRVLIIVALLALAVVIAIFLLGRALLRGY